MKSTILHAISLHWHAIWNSPFFRGLCRRFLRSFLRNSLRLISLSRPGILLSNFSSSVLDYFFNSFSFFHRLWILWVANWRPVYDTKKKQKFLLAELMKLFQFPLKYHFQKFPAIFTGIFKFSHLSSKCSFFGRRAASVTLSVQHTKWRSACNIRTDAQMDKVALIGCFLRKKAQKLQKKFSDAIHSPRSTTLILLVCFQINICFKLSILHSLIQFSRCNNL